MLPGVMLAWVEGGKSWSQERRAGAHQPPPPGPQCWGLKSEQQNNSEEEIKIGKRHINVRAAFKDGAIKPRPR